MNSVIAKANELVNALYEKMSVIESSEVILRELDGSDIQLTKDGKVVDIASVLSVDQRAEIIYSIRTMIQESVDDASKYINGFDKQPIPTTPFVSKMTVPEVTKMLEDGMSTQEIADFYEYKTKKTVETFIKKNNIVIEQPEPVEEIIDEPVVEEVKSEPKTEPKPESKPKKELSDADIPFIESNYTRGGMTLGQAASQLGVNKKVLHDFVNKKFLNKINK